ncbi:hypothetical protein O181_049279 [Austropuccinia psidii MF-1]|uniref:Uncharacterized protein n=1 Tax=Austropuccinia psidii MF-1 TaxID=1389203 RepID=A0A9Q3DUL3_9BASI|nr:hypothetical protein [Austropuccinia psidii MF-1]
MSCDCAARFHMPWPPATRRSASSRESHSTQIPRGSDGHRTQTAGIGERKSDRIEADVDVAPLLSKARLSLKIFVLVIFKSQSHHSRHPSNHCKTQSCMMPSASPEQKPSISSESSISNSIYKIPHTQIDPHSCSLLGPFAILIQAIMALIILVSLLVKRHREKPKRKYQIWTADVSKQVIGQAFVHLLNIFISAIMAQLPSGGNPCALYFINIFIDTTIGVFVLFITLNLLTHLSSILFNQSPINLGLASGTYPPPFFMSWLKQLAIYLLSLAILKLFVIALFYLGGDALIRFGDGLIEAISSNPKTQIVIVVMIGPTILNVLQFLLIDSFIKHKPPPVNHQSLQHNETQAFLNDHDHDSDHDNNLNQNHLNQNHPNSLGSDDQDCLGSSNPYKSKSSSRRQTNRNLDSSPLDPCLTPTSNAPHCYPPKRSSNQINPIGLSDFNLEIRQRTPLNIKHNSINQITQLNPQNHNLFKPMLNKSLILTHYSKLWSSSLKISNHRPINSFNPSDRSFESQRLGCPTQIKTGVSLIDNENQKRYHQAQKSFTHSCTSTIIN